MNHSIKSISQLIHNGNGKLLSNYYDINFIRDQRIFNSEGIKNTQFGSQNEPIAESLDLIFKMNSSNSPKETFDLYIQATSIIIRSFNTLNQNLSFPILNSIGKSLKYYALNFDYNESVTQLQKLLPLAINTHSSIDSCLLNIVNDLLSLYFLRNNFKNVEYVFKGIETKIGSKINLNNYFPYQISSYHYNLGKLYSIKCNFLLAKEHLMEALKYTPDLEIQNKRLIYLYLIPIQLCLNSMLKPENIEKINLSIYNEIHYALLTGDLKLFDDQFNFHQLLFIKLGIFELLMKVRQRILLRLLIMAHKIVNSSKVPLIAFKIVLSNSIEHSIDEAESICASLIKEGLVKAYISHEHKLIVFSQNEPFPKLNK